MRVRAWLTEGEEWQVPLRVLGVALVAVASLVLLALVGTLVGPPAGDAHLQAHSGPAIFLLFVGAGALVGLPGILLLAITARTPHLRRAGLVLGLGPVALLLLGAVTTVGPALTLWLPLVLGTWVGIDGHSSRPASVTLAWVIAGTWLIGLEIPFANVHPRGSIGLAGVLLVALAVRERERLRWPHVAGQALLAGGVVAAAASGLYLSARGRIPPDAFLRWSRVIYWAATVGAVIVLGPPAANWIGRRVGR